MLSRWQLPRQVSFGEKAYPFHGDFRDILEIIAYLDDPALPEFIRWQIALRLFYREPIPGEHQNQAMEYLARFLTGGVEETGRPGPKRLDWQQDADLIVADVNRVAGQEIRALPFVHWWTFLSWFHGIGDGQVATLVRLREALAKGRKLEDWEKEYYRLNRRRVELKKQYTPQELAQRKKLEKLLDGG